MAIGRIGCFLHRLLKFGRGGGEILFGSGCAIVRAMAVIPGRKLFGCNPAL